MSIIRQTICTVIVCNLTLNLGIMYALPSSTLKLFASATNTTLNRAMTETEISLYGSLSCISPLITTPLSGFLIDIMGRKYSCIMFAVPQVVSWTLMSTFPTVAVLLVAIFISGLGNCLFVLVPVYVSEICHKSIRGTMTSGCIVFYGIGIMVSYILGGYLEYDTMKYVCLSNSVVGVLAMLIVRESPTYLMKKGLEKEAAKTIAFYRSVEPDSKEVLQEIEEIRRALNPILDNGRLKIDKDTPEKLSLFKFFRKSRSTQRGLVVALMMYFITIFQGLLLVQVYLKPVFEEALPSVSANLSTILFALVNIIAGFIAACLLDYAGRRPVMIYSSVACGICCIGLGTQIQLHWGPNWLTGILLYAYCITSTCGAGTAPYVVIAEVFLPEVRGPMTMLSVEWGWTCNFIGLFIFNPLLTAVGLGPVFYIFAMISVISTVFCYFLLPETKGLPVDVIQTLLLKKRQNGKC